MSCITETRMLWDCDLCAHRIRTDPDTTPAGWVRITVPSLLPKVKDVCRSCVENIIEARDE